MIGINTDGDKLGLVVKFIVTDDIVGKNPDFFSFVQGTFEFCKSDLIFICANAARRTNIGKFIFQSAIDEAVASILLWVGLCKAIVPAKFLKTWS